MSFFRYRQKAMHRTFMNICLTWIIFVGKNFVLKFLGQKVFKMRLSNFCKKSMHGTFLKFCMRLQQGKGLNWLKRFSCEKACAGIFRQKGVQHEFCEFYNKLMYWLFLFSTWSYRSRQIFLTKFLFWDSWDCAWNDVFKFYGKWKFDMFLIFCMNL